MLPSPTHILFLTVIINLKVLRREREEKDRQRQRERGR
jgi:hypothetical protein